MSAPLSWQRPPAPAAARCARRLARVGRTAQGAAHALRSDADGRALHVAGSSDACAAKAAADLTGWPGARALRPAGAAPQPAQQPKARVGGQGKRQRCTCSLLSHPAAAAAASGAPGMLLPGAHPSVCTLAPLKPQAAAACTVPRLPAGGRPAACRHAARGAQPLLGLAGEAHLDIHLGARGGRAPCGGAVHAEQHAKDPSRVKQAPLQAPPCCPFPYPLANAPCPALPAGACGF